MSREPSETYCAKSGTGFLRLHVSKNVQEERAGPQYRQCLCRFRIFAITRMENSESRRIFSKHRGLILAIIGIEAAVLNLPTFQFV